MPKLQQISVHVKYGRVCNFLGAVVKHYVIPFLCMTLLLHIMARNRWCKNGV